MSQLFGEKGLLLGTNATETAFKAEPLADFDIIHIAAHGIASAKFPDRAALVLGNDPKSGEDGLLQVRKIRDLNLAADLVTLSTCDTGVGALEGEEGIANLVRAFLFAGAKSVVASLWAASDVYTLNLMQHVRPDRLLPLWRKRAARGIRGVGDGIFEVRVVSRAEGNRQAVLHPGRTPARRKATSIFAAFRRHKA